PDSLVTDWVRPPSQLRGSGGLTPASRVRRGSARLAVTNGTRQAERLERLRYGIRNELLPHSCDPGEASHPVRDEYQRSKGHGRLEGRCKTFDESPHDDDDQVEDDDAPGHRWKHDADQSPASPPAGIVIEGLHRRVQRIQTVLSAPESQGRRDRRQDRE